MERITRREIVRGAVAAAVFGGAGTAAASTQDDKPGDKPPPPPKYPGRELVIEAGMTEEEADCWGSVNTFAGAYLRLAARDGGHEHVHLIHVLQKALLMRPAYRAYMDAAGGGNRTVRSDGSLAELANDVDRERALAGGLNETETQCWELLVRFTQAYRDLPKLHPMEDHEVAHALRALRNRILAGPILRRYAES